MKYTVKPGDTLSGLAKEFLGDYSYWRDIAEASKLANPNVLNVGDVLTIPVRTTTRITEEQIRPLSQYISSEERSELVDVINHYLPIWGITEPLEIAHFLAQVSHESAGFKARTENLNYSAKALRLVFGKYFKTDEEAAKFARKPEAIANIVYANRMGNGPAESGDGWKYRGQGYIQLTGFDNYEAAAEELRLPIMSDPSILSSNVRMALKVSAWYWEKYRLEEYALRDDLVGLTKRINGGTHGLASRERLTNTMKEAMGLAA